MKRLDQGHLHPKLEVPRLTCRGLETNPASEVGGEHSRIEPFEHLMLLLYIQKVYNMYKNQFFVYRNKDYCCEYVNVKM
jgi:hypothetical protein